MNKIILFYNISSDNIIAINSIEDHKKDKIRIIIAFTCNANEIDQFKSLFIEWAIKSWYFNKKTERELGFLYFHNKRAWMIDIRV